MVEACFRFPFRRIKLFCIFRFELNMLYSVIRSERVPWIIEQTVQETALDTAGWATWYCPTFIWMTDLKLLLLFMYKINANVWTTQTEVPKRRGDLMATCTEYARSYRFWHRRESTPFYHFISHMIKRNLFIGKFCCSSAKNRLSKQFFYRHQNQTKMSIAMQK